MLLPVGAVSAVAAPIEKPVVVTAETAGLQTAATPLAVLSSAINANVEGKLNMLLVAARERMFDSLLSAIDAAGAALNVSREPGESDAAFAQRIAATIRSLPPQQLAEAQQRLNAQISTPIPLLLLAKALENPESPQALQLALSLEPAPSAEPDAALKAVVNSYGQNAGEPESVVTQTPTPALTQKAADMAAQAALLTGPVKEAGPSTALPAAAQPVAQPAQALQEAPSPSASTSPVPAAAVQAAPAQAIAQSGSAPAPQVAPGANIDANATLLSSQLASLVDDLTAGPLLAAIAAETKLPTEVELIRSPLTPPPVPRDIQQIQADIKQGLQVVINPPVAAASSALLQIISNPAASVEQIIAQALTANGARQMSPQPQPAVDESGRSRLVAAGFTPTALAAEPEASVSVASLAGKPQPQTSAGAATAMLDTPEQMGVLAPIPLGVPFVVANYLPAATPTKDAESKPVDRVDPVEDEEDEEGEEASDGDKEQHETEDDSQAPESSPQAAEETSGDTEAQLVSSQDAVVAPDLPALPQPAPADRPQDHAFDFYRRMVEWE
ncbi:hypothetical protein [Rhizobium lusitanum]|jgi:hypothetical protein|uniref:hypothetical protein n=1 Tax=Rhizobium lusitanum TaxID=293958 RepID=UPI00055BD76B|nr:hypothetical protein [Rhizobium lusitanum]NTJ05439.1 hypothetical protein [Rhizobium lusitanum]